MLFTALVAVMGLTSSAYAQFSAGTTVVGGSLSYSQKQHEMYGFGTEKTTIITPRVGTFFQDDLEAGLQLSYVHGSWESNDPYWGNTTNANDMLMFAPYARKYFSLNEWAGFYMQGAIAYGWGRRGGEDLSKSVGRSRLWAASVAPGITIRVGERVGIDFQANLLEFTSQTYGHKDDYSKTESKPVESFNIGPNFSKLSLGVSFYL